MSDFDVVWNTFKKWVERKKVSSFKGRGDGPMTMVGVQISELVADFARTPNNQRFLEKLLGRWNQEKLPGVVYIKEANWK